MKRLLVWIARRRRQRSPDTLYTLRLCCAYLDAGGQYALSDAITASVFGPIGAEVRLDRELLSDLDVWLTNRGWPRLAAGMAQSAIGRAQKDGRA